MEIEDILKDIENMGSSEQKISSLKVLVSMILRENEILYNMLDLKKRITKSKSNITLDTEAEKPEKSGILDKIMTPKPLT